MKVALIGNMNNNHFSMLRYFRDLGVDAYLFKYANEQSHFQPECDTYEIEKWEKYIIQTPIVDGDFVQYLKYSKKDLFEIFKGYDYYIGNGFSPAYLNKAGIKLNLYIPYSSNIEYTFRLQVNNLFDKIKEKLVAYTQIKALKENVEIACISDLQTANKAKSFGMKVINYIIPMVYVNSSTNKHSIDLRKSYGLTEDTFSVFSHVSHFNINTFAYSIKQNHILFEGFAKYMDQNPNHNSRLFLLEYGEGVDYSKEIIRKLGIENKVIWLPKMLRKELMGILSQIDIGAGEFGGSLWGGTGWEFLSKGKLFLQYVDSSNEEISKSINAPCPEFVNSNDPDYIAKQLSYYYNHRELLIEKAKMLTDWFNENAGYDLVKKYIKLIPKNTP